jgi:transposase
MMNELSVTERETILGLLRLGWSHRRVARETGHRRETIARYGREAGLLPAKPATARKAATDPSKPATVGELPTDLSTPAIAVEAPTGPVDTTAGKARSRSVCEPYRGFIEAEVAKGCNATVIYQSLVEHHGYDDAYDAVKRFVRRLHPAGGPKISCRFETPAGQESQVDYGEGAPTRHPRTGKYQRPRLFVLTLAMSRAMFVKVVWKSSKQVWAELHEEAFIYFGGATTIVRPDNLKEGVLDPDIYDPEINELYAAALAHYGSLALPCRPYAPNLKGKVEFSIGYVQRALKGKRFESIEEQNAHLMRWNERWASTRIHGTTKRQVRVMFEEERPSLLPLPPTRFEYFRTGERTVHFDGFIEVDGAYYHAPPHYVGTRVAVQIGRLWIRIIDPKTHQLLREHAVTGKGQRRIIEADLPKQSPPKLINLVERIAKIGPSCGVFARAIENERGVMAARTLFGVLDLARRYGPASLENACALAVTARAWRLRFLRAYLERHPAPSLTADHKIIAPIDTYSQHFAFLAKGNGETHDNG